MAPLCFPARSWSNLRAPSPAASARRVFGKMGHSERYTTGNFANVPGNHYQPLFEGGVAYFK